MTISRREFIARIAQAGGYGAAFMTMHSLGLLGMVETEQRKDFPLPPIDRPRNESDYSRRRNCRAGLRL